MREQLTDIIRQVAPLFKKIKITGDDSSTKVEAFDDDKILVLRASLKEPVAEFTGQFGISSLPMLGGLLSQVTYKAEGASLLVHRSDVGDYVSEFEFREKRGGLTRFKTMNPRLVESAQISNIPWHIMIQPTKSSIAELTSFAALFAEVDTMFGVKVDNQTLFITIGGGASGTHTSSVVFATDIKENYSSAGATYNTRHLLAVLKNAGTNPTEVRFSELGVASVIVETDYGIYTYYLRAKSI